MYVRSSSASKPKSSCDSPRRFLTERDLVVVEQHTSRVWRLVRSEERVRRVVLERRGVLQASSRAEKAGYNASDAVFANFLMPMPAR